MRASVAVSVLCFFLATGCGSTADLTQAPSTTRSALQDGNSVLTQINTVFLIVMENHNWSWVVGRRNAPFINKQLLPIASHAKNYHNPPFNHPSLPNYIWLHAGDNLDIFTDLDPEWNHQATDAHLFRQLTDAGISWKSYQEDIDGTTCPLTSAGNYAAKHNPNVYFDDMTSNQDPNDAFCIAHNRPFTELSSDLASGTQPRYIQITPNLCHDMHNSCPPLNDTLAQGDAWLAQTIPMLVGSQAFRDNGAIFITWDESELLEEPIGMIVLSPLARGGGYGNAIEYTHSSTLRTFQTIFQVTPWLGDAANAADLSDLFID